jgi:aspartyl-tRNA synthetase
MSYDEAMSKYGNDKPDIRFGMLIHELTNLAKGKGFKVFDSVDYIGGISVEQAASYSRKQLDALTANVTRPQNGAKGLLYEKCNEDGSFKSSVDKFFNADQLKEWADAFRAKPGDLLLILAGGKDQTQRPLYRFR